MCFDSKKFKHYILSVYNIFSTKIIDWSFSFILDQYIRTGSRQHVDELRMLERAQVMVTLRDSARIVENLITDFLDSRKILIWYSARSLP